MPCLLCRKRGKTWEGSDPICAFDERGVFKEDNWNCATMNVLRDFAEELGFYHRDDLVTGSIGFLPFEHVTEDEDSGGHVVMTWYKNHGSTDSAYVLFLGEQPRPLTEKEALEAIEYCGRKFESLKERYKEVFEWIREGGSA